MDPTYWPWITGALAAIVLLQFFGRHRRRRFAGGCPRRAVTNGDTE